MLDAFFFSPPYLFLIEPLNVSFGYPSHSGAQPLPIFIHGKEILTCVVCPTTLKTKSGKMLCKNMQSERSQGIRAGDKIYNIHKRNSGDWLR